jgi:hypothetical protein
MQVNVARVVAAGEDPNDVRICDQSLVSETALEDLAMMPHPRVDGALPIRCDQHPGS